MRWCIPICLIILFSCGEEKKNAAIDLNEIMPEATMDKDSGKPKDSEPDDQDQLFNFSLADSLTLGIQKAELRNYRMILDRFSPVVVKNITLIGEKDSVLLGVWNYADSIKTANAFYNWLDCFGNDCRSIRLLEKAKFQKHHMLTMANDTMIVYISSATPIDKKKWVNYFISEKGIHEWDYVIDQKKGRVSEWLMYGIPNGFKKEQFYSLTD